MAKLDAVSEASANLPGINPDIVTRYMNLLLQRGCDAFYESHPGVIAIKKPLSVENFAQIPSTVSGPPEAARPVTKTIVTTTITQITVYE